VNQLLGAPGADPQSVMVSRLSVAFIVVLGIFFTLVIARANKRWNERDAAAGELPPGLEADV
jgi:hypothetical protein